MTITSLLAPLALLSLASSVTALNTLPNVTAVPVTDCSAFPNYDASTGLADQWLIWVNQSNSPAEGYGDATQIVYDGSNGVHIVRVSSSFPSPPYSFDLLRI